MAFHHCKRQISKGIPPRFYLAIRGLLEEPPGAVPGRGGNTFVSSRKIETANKKYRCSHAVKTDQAEVKARKTNQRPR